MHGGTSFASHTIRSYNYLGGFFLVMCWEFLLHSRVKYQIMTDLKIHGNNVFMESRKKEPGFEHPPIFLV
jgi:hypothetical protein